MKITREMMLLATANVLANSPTKELLETTPDIEDIFIKYAYLLHLEIKDKDITKTDFFEKATNTILKLFINETKEVTIVIGLALVAFSSLIYKELIKINHADNSDTIITLKELFSIIDKIDK